MQSMPASRKVVKGVLYLIAYLINDGAEVVSVSIAPVVEEDGWPRVKGQECLSFKHSNVLKSLS